MKQIDDQSLEYLLLNPHAAVYLFAEEVESMDSTQTGTDAIPLDPYTGEPLVGSAFPEGILTNGQSLGLGRDRSTLHRLIASSNPMPTLVERFLSLAACDEAIDVEDVGVFYAYRSKTTKSIAEEASTIDLEQLVHRLRTGYLAATTQSADVADSTMRYQLSLLRDLKAYLLDSSRKGLGILLVEV